ncbi:MAG TPA: zinc-dependent metalloprotease [Vicinamibacterales bacterium]|nr:zinc-dependent metalloprotease [Vicinamibacterales bacterium]
MSRLAVAIVVLLALISLSLPGSSGLIQPSTLYAAAQRGGATSAPAHVPTIEERTKGLQALDGYFPLYWDAQAGTLLLEIPRFDTEFLFATGLSAGLGSNDIGLDRGQEGGGKVVAFHRVGPKVLLTQVNLNFRSSSPDAAEQRSVADSFARSVLWGFPIAAESGGRVLVDMTDFLVRDFHGARRSLRPGTFRVDRSRSAIEIAHTKAFPKNTEMDVVLTFVNEANGPARGGIAPPEGPPRIGQAPGGARGGGRGLFSGSVASVTPTADAVTLREHASFLELPDAHFQTREDDPRAGFGGITYVDYSAPIGDPIVKHLIRRWRLVKKDPAAATSDPVTPIQYYVDAGAPDDVRQALMDGAGWWNQAFEAAGFTNAFKIDVLPEGADPMDIRYNMINWIHRSTRGYSSGASVTDPRTGEILKATVTLGSLRDRQDYLMFEGLLSPYSVGNERSPIVYQSALARIRQLAAHEVGHTLGLGHNYYDSTAGRISVMDYPHPLGKLNADGTIDLSDAYTRAIGPWDKVAIDYGYRVFPSGANEHEALENILNDAWSKDLRYLTNQDTDVNPKADQWSNGVNQADELNRIMKIRRAALNRIGDRTIRTGAPTATIEEPFVTAFMYHRYAVEAAASMIGGQDYIYAMRGDGRTPLTWESAANQRKALDAIAAALKPSELTVPKAVLERITPRPPGYGLHRDLFPRTTGGAFDPLSPATTAADVTIGFVLELDRAARLVAQHAVEPSRPGLGEVIDTLITATFDAPTANAYESEVRRAEEHVLVDRLTWLAQGASNPQVRAVASLRLSRLAARLRSQPGADDGDRAQHALLAADIKRFLERPAAAATTITAAPQPPGAPIGDTGMDFLAGSSWCRWSEGHPDWW